MPQLEQINTFVSQIFWLFAAFGIIYFFVSKKAAPQIDDIISKRQNIILGDIEVASSSKEEARIAFEELDKKIQSSKAQAQSTISASAGHANKFYNDELAKAESIIKEDATSAETSITSAKDSVLEQLRKESAVFVEDILNKLAGIKVDKNTLEKALSQTN